MSTTSPPSALKDRYTDVLERIARAAPRAGRAPGDIVLVAVSKTAEPDQIRELMRLGQIDFGENRVQQLVQRAAIIDEWLGRVRVLPGVQRPAAPSPDDLFTGARSSTAAAQPPACRWHMIGHLQRNKARKVVDLCRLIHSLDSLRLAEELQAIAVRRDRPIEVLLQVNCSGEPQKFGCAVPAARHLVEQIETMVHVRVRGLMCMAPYSTNPEDARPTFARCRDLFEDIRRSGVVTPAFNVLSMGMSGDFEIAVEEGANLIRVGSAIFGEGRPDTDFDQDEDD